MIEDQANPKLESTDLAGARVPARIRRLPAFSQARIKAFVYFTVRRFLDESCLQTAGALSFTSLFALVPLITVVLGILAAFPVFAQWRDHIAAFLFDNFVPTAGNVVQTYFTQFADNASKATAIGIIVLVVSAIALMLSIEDAFNRIWRVSTARKAAARLTMYWAVLTLGPLLLVTALASSSYLFALPFLERADAQLDLKAHALGFLPFILEWIALSVAYILIPNRRVSVRGGVFGALIAALLFELAKRGFAAYVTREASYQEIYGALATIPIFILWIYVSWILVLLGASLTASMAAFEYSAPVAEIEDAKVRSDPSNATIAGKT